MPHNSKNSHRAEASIAKNTPYGKISDTKLRLADFNSEQTEDQKIAAMFKLSADQWSQQQLEMAK